MRLELYKRQNGAVLARHTDTSAQKGFGQAMFPGPEEHRLGECCLPPDSLSPGFVNALERDGWAIAAGNDRALLLMVAHAVGYRATHEPGTSLIEAAIDAACRSIRPESPASVRQRR